MSFASPIRIFYRYIIYYFVCSFCSLYVDAATKHEPGYSFGQTVPISCLSRSIENGEHVCDTSHIGQISTTVTDDFQIADLFLVQVTDEAGKLQYIPFPTCNETSSPLSFHYGVSETINCTVDELSDTLYHLLEYYVHSDVPLTCRMPTLPLLDDDHHAPHKASDAGSASSPGSGGGAETAFTPLTIALQGTLQLSHLHIWTDTNVLLHWIPVSETKGAKSQLQQKKKKKKPSVTDIKTDPGLILAGTAYSVPEHSVDSKENAASDTVDKAVPLDPWAPGQGSKVRRGEPLQFTFRVRWVRGAQILPADRTSSGKGIGGFFSTVFLFLMAAGVGAIVALLWDRKRREGNGWRGDGLLGRPSNGRITVNSAGSKNGYGGYRAAGNGLSPGYGGYSIAKKE